MAGSIAEGEAKRAVAARSSPAEKGGQPDGLDDVAALLAEQLGECHVAATRCFAIANDPEGFEMPVRMDALKLATRLVQASAAAASAVKRLKGGEFHHRVTVARFDYAAEQAAARARQQTSHLDALNQQVAGAREKLAAKLDRIAEVERERYTPEEHAAMDSIRQAADARARHGRTP